MKVTVHNFSVSLNRSLDIQREPFWLQVYESFFGKGVTLISNEVDGPGQRLGADRVIVLPGSTACIRIDEKVRHKSYPDILLEYLSSKEQNKPGWVCKPLLADYIAYVNLPMEVCHLLSVHTLQRAWRLYGEQWKKQYEDVVADNETYHTISTPVPVNVLRKAMDRVMRIPFFRNIDQKDKFTVIDGGKKK